MNKILANRINSMAREDQVMRREQAKDATRWNPEIDKRNTRKLKKIVAQHGWPDIKLVGKKASDNAWLLVQHADHDLRWQKKCLKLITNKHKQGLVNPQNVAYLTDRILMHEGKYLLYGTQFYKTKKGIFKEKPIADRKNLEKRRKEVGLETFVSYKKKMIALAKKYNW